MEPPLQKTMDLLGVSGDIRAQSIRNASESLIIRPAATIPPG
jgi:hypothetical protein